MRQRANLLTALSIGACLLFAACNDDVPRPDTYVCLANVPDLKLTCYNLLRDYDNRGSLLKDAKPVVTVYADAVAMLVAMNKSYSTDPVGWARIKAYIRNLRGEGQ